MPPVDGRIEIVCSLQTRFSSEAQGDRVDFLDRGSFNAVNAGDVLPACIIQSQVHQGKMCTAKWCRLLRHGRPVWWLALGEIGQKRNHGGS